MYIKHLTKINDSDIDLVGGKAVSISKLTKNDFSIPRGFVVTSTLFKDTLQKANINDFIDHNLSLVDINDFKSLLNCANKIQEKIENLRIEEENVNEILITFDTMKLSKVAVRSSAIEEDNMDTSWAGQFETVLNVERENLIESIKKCWSSLYSPRSISYRFSKNIIKSNTAMPVIIQEMISGEYSGITFTINPVTKDSNRIIIEGGEGLGESFVSGSVKADRYIIDKERIFILDKSISYQQKKLVVKEDGGTEWVQIQNNKQKLEDTLIKEIASKAKLLELQYKHPVDIEWTIRNNELFLLQCRPITVT